MMLNTICQLSKLLINSLKKKRAVLITFKNEEAISRVEIENIHSSISYLNLQIEQAKSQKNKEEVKEKKQALKNQEERLKKAEEGYNNAFKAIEQISKVLESGKRKAEKRLSKYSEISGIYLPQQENKASETPQIITKEIEYDKPYPTSFQPAKEKSKSEYTCSVIFDGKDESMGVKRKQIEPASFFAFTPPSMKPVLKSDNFLKCDVSLAKIDGDYYMLLQFRIRSKDAKKNYGFIQIGERLRITTVKGNSIYCKAVNKAEGRLEQYTGNTLYNAMYKIEKEDLGKIKKQYIDEVGVIWTSGFESYKVYNVDLLKNQMECLESKK